jgi:DNA-binding response OmpR family regulator
MNMKILVVDDDAISRDTLAEMLRKHRYGVVTAASGREALEILVQGDCRMVISDWVMPEVNGPTLCRAIRKGEFSSYVYIILLTVRKSHEDVVEGLSAGADDFMTKPFYPSELRVRIRAGERAGFEHGAVTGLCANRQWATGPGQSKEESLALPFALSPILLDERNVAKRWDTCERVRSRPGLPGFMDKCQQIEGVGYLLGNDCPSLVSNAARLHATGRAACEAPREFTPAARPTRGHRAGESAGGQPTARRRDRS